VPGIRSPLMVNGVAVVSAPAELDTTTAEQLRTVLIDAGSHEHATVVVDMTRTQFCDSSGLSVLVRAHRRAVAEGGELRLVLPADGPVARVVTLTGLHRLFPCFGSLDQALTPGPTAATLPVHPRSPAGLRSDTRQPGHPAERCERVAQRMLEASVTTEESGPVIVLTGEADMTCAEQLSELLTGQLAGGIRHLTIDVSGLRFADSASIQMLVLTAKTLKERDGSLVLLHPQRPVAKVLALLGAEQMITIRGKAPAVPRPETGAADGR
jgi:anti-sigma B factor antagonist